MPAGIKEIAERLGLSIGTVDRALHDRPGINALTRKRVLRMAKSVGYRPNLAARSLRSRTRVRISVNLPREIAFFYDAVREGIRKAAAPFESTICLDYRGCKRLGEGDAELFEQALQEGANGIIVAPGNPALMRPLIRRAARANVPVVCVSTDAPRSERLTAVSTQPHTSGAMAAEMLSRCHPAGGEAVIMTGFRDTVDHAEKVRGFGEWLARAGSRLETVEVVETHDSAPEALHQARAVLERYPKLAAMYITTANSLPVLRALQATKRLGQVTVIATDVFPKLVPLIRSGAVAASIYQRPTSQGRIAFESLYRFLADGTCPPGQIRLLPHIIMSSNIDLLLARLTIEDE